MVQFAETQGAVAVALHVAGYNAAACTLYERLGFVRLRTHLDFYHIAPERSPLPPQTRFNAFLYALPLVTRQRGRYHNSATASTSMPSLQRLWDGWQATWQQLPFALCAGGRPQSHAGGAALPPLTSVAGNRTAAEQAQNEEARATQQDAAATRSCSVLHTDGERSCANTRTPETAAIGWQCHESCPCSSQQGARHRHASVCTQHACKSHADAQQRQHVSCDDALDHVSGNEALSSVDDHGSGMQWYRRLFGRPRRHGAPFPM